MKYISTIAAALLLVTAAACAPVVIGAGAAGGYKVGTDERTVGTMWNDTSITARVNKALADDSVAPAYKIDVDTTEGVVTLNGVVETDHQAQRAVEVAQGVEGVRQVKSFLQVGRPSAGETLDDSVIFSKVKSKLIGEPGIRSMNVDVDVNLGVVTVSGVVKDRASRDRIVVLARETPGVVRVIDNLTVRTP